MNIQEVKLREFTKEEVKELMQKDFIQVDESFSSISNLCITIELNREVMVEDKRYNELEFLFFFPKKFQEEYSLVMNKIKDSERQRQELREELSR